MSCEAEEGWRVILGIYATDLGAEETSEHSERSAQVWGSGRDVSCHIATDQSCDGFCRPGFDPCIFVLEIEKCVRFVGACDVSTVAQQHSCDRSVSHGHAFQLSAVQLRIPREVPMVHCEDVDGYGGVSLAPMP